MQPNAFAARAYSQNARSVGTPRSIEYQAFSRITASLRAVAKAEAAHGERVRAILQNNKLWALLAADLLSENNTLPKELRAQLLSLAEFSRKHGLKAMSGEAEVELLIDINLTVMRGLRGEEASAASTEQADAASAVQAGGTPAGVGSTAAPF